MFVYRALFRAWLLNVYHGWCPFGLVALLLMPNEHQVCHGFISMWHCFPRPQLALSRRPVVVPSGQCDCSVTACHLCCFELEQHCLVLKWWWAAAGIQIIMQLNTGSRWVHCFSFDSQWCEVSVCCELVQRKRANPHIWKAGTTKYFWVDAWKMTQMIRGLWK